MTASRVFVESAAFWAPTLPGWREARAAFRDEAPPLATPAKRPAPELLAPAERRRAPDTVALALEVAAAAVRGAGLAPETLPAIFTSAHGDLAVNDYMCSTLASTPALISPTKFHNSVHNAAAGYWTIATGCREASTAVSAFDASFGAGFLEAAVQCAADRRAVLLVAFDVEATGALASVTASTGLLACALVLAPERSARSIASIDWSLANGRHVPTPLASAAARDLAGNAMAGAVPVFETIARLAPEAPAVDGTPTRSASSTSRAADASRATIVLPLGPTLALALAFEATPASAVAASTLSTLESTTSP